MAWKILGINDEVTVCECCARRNLKKTVILSNGDEERRYGTACAAKALGRKEAHVKAEAIGYLETQYRNAQSDYQRALIAFAVSQGKHASAAHACRVAFEGTEQGQALASRVKVSHSAWRASA